MTSLNLLIIELILSQLLLLILYKKYNIIGIYTFATVSLLLSCIMSQKTINLFEYDVNLGIIPMINTFLAMNILIQKEGPEKNKSFILTSIIFPLIGSIILYLTTKITSSNINLFTSASYDNIFNNSARIVFACLVTTLYSLLLNAKLYYYLKKMKNNLLISNLFSTIIIHFISSILFSVIAYAFIKDPIDIIKIIMIRYLISLSVGLIGTIPIYLTKYQKKQ